MKTENPMKSDAVIPTCGGVVFADDRILFILKGDRWELPKGKMDGSETKEETALREISEETGLLKTDLLILEQLPTTYYYKIIDGVKRLKKTNWFFIKYTGDVNRVFKPAVNEGITECKWISVDSMSEVYRNTHVRIMYLMDFVNQKYSLWD